MGLVPSRLSAVVRGGIVPLYLYQCFKCLHRDGRIGGVDDHAAICDRCGCLMIRLDNEIFAPYFEYQERKNKVANSQGR